jgi:hypothetical protein
MNEWNDFGTAKKTEMDMSTGQHKMEKGIRAIKE